MNGPVRLLALTCLLVAAAIVVGCGSSDSDSTSSDSGTTPAAETDGGSSAAKGVAEATALMEEAMSGEQELPSPPDQVDPGTGKAGVITCAAIGEGCSSAAEQARNAFLAMGWTAPPVADGEFTPAVQGAFIEQFVREDFDAIVMVAVDPTTVQAAVDDAAAKGIPIACVACVSPPEFDGKVIDVGTGGLVEGHNLGYWTVATSNGEANVLALGDDAFPVVGKRVEGLKSVIDELCPDCEYEEQKISAADVGKPGPPWFNALISANPAGELEYIVVPYDVGALPASETAQQRGRSELLIGSQGDGDAANIEAIYEDNTPLKADSIAPFLFMGWAGADIAMREKIGAQTWDASELPSILVTKENAAEYRGEPGTTYAPKVDTFESVFLKSWGK